MFGRMAKFVIITPGITESEKLGLF